MNALEYRTAAIDLVIRLTGCPREWAEEVCDVETSNDWHDRWGTGERAHATVAEYVAAAFLDHGFSSSGEFAADDEYAPAWLGRGAYR